MGTVKICSGTVKICSEMVKIYSPPKKLFQNLFQAPKLSKTIHKPLPGVKSFLELFKHVPNFTNLYGYSPTYKYCIFKIVSKYLPSTKSVLKLLKPLSDFLEISFRCKSTSETAKTSFEFVQYLLWTSLNVFKIPTTLSLFLRSFSRSGISSRHKKILRTILRSLLDVKVCSNLFWTNVTVLESLTDTEIV